MHTIKEPFYIPYIFFNISNIINEKVTTNILIIFWASSEYLTPILWHNKTLNNFYLSNFCANYAVKAI